MNEYQKPYLCLWRGISEALSELELQNFGEAKRILMKAQQDAEEAYLESEAETDK